MCGIAGISSFNATNIDVNVLKQMHECLSHRGPDGHGLYRSDNIGLTHNRLAIIDLSNSGNQPMSIEENNSQYVISFNGEIYNYKSLRSELIQLGFHFRSGSDTEVILVAYQAFGEDAWKRLDGFFSFALWDSNKQVLYLVRDALGVKPLYYSISDNSIFFSSEIKSLLNSKVISDEISLEALSDFFTHFYIPAPKTPFQSISQLEAGTFLKFSKSGFEIMTYWELVVERCTECRNFRDHKLHLREEIAVALKESLVSDVPLMLLLSGGLDSSVILAELNQSHKEMSLRTFTVGFKDKHFDERNKVNELSKYIDFSNEQVVVSDLRIVDFFDAMIFHSDSLNANFANIPEYLMFKEVAKKSKVVLTGMGMDELYAGYSTYLADRMAKIYRGSLPKFLRRFILRAMEYVPEGHGRYPLKWVLRKFLEGSELDEITRHFYWRSIFSESEKENLFGDNFALIRNHDPNTIHRNHVKGLKGKPTTFDRLLYADLRTFCVDNANVLMDGMSMAHSVEARPPFLSKRFVEFSFSLPDKFKLRFFKGKFIVRRAYFDLLPKFIVRGKKLGLVSPVDNLLRTELRELLINSVDTMTNNSIIDKSYVSQLLEEHLSNKENHGYKLYLILVYLRWRLVFIGST